MRMEQFLDICGELNFIFAKVISPHLSHHSEELFANADVLISFRLSPSWTHIGSYGAFVVSLIADYVHSSIDHLLLFSPIEWNTVQDFLQREIRPVLAGQQGFNDLWR